MKKIKDFFEPINEKSIILCCVLRDELILLEYFIKYYTEIKITHFIFIDNGSIDGSFEYLSNLDNINIMLFQTHDSYKDNSYGVDWINNILMEYCKDKWCLVVDIDEILEIKEPSLEELRDNMIKSNSNMLLTCLLDMYPKEDKIYNKGENFLTHSSCYDKFNKEYYSHNMHHKFNNMNKIHGGVRNRVYSINCCLSKRSFFRFDFYDYFELFVGYHWVNSKVCSCGIFNICGCNYDKIRYYDTFNFLLHFKFIKPDLNKFFENRIKNNQDWDNSSEYKTYLNNTKNLFSDEYSIKYNGFIDKTKFLTNT